MSFSKSYRYTKDYHDTEDAVVTAFNKVFEKISFFQFQGEGSLSKWISTIVINTTINLIKRKKKLIFLEDESEYDTPVDWEENIPDFDERYYKQVLKIIDSMPDGYRLVLMMNIMEGYTHREIAESLGVSINTSKSQVLKAKKFIRKQLNEF